MNPSQRVGVVMLAALAYWAGKAGGYREAVRAFELGAHLVGKGD